MLRVVRPMKVLPSFTGVLAPPVSGLGAGVPVGA